MFEAFKLAIIPYLSAIKIAAVVLVFLAGCLITREYYVNQLNEAIIARQKAEAKFAATASDVRVEFIKTTNTIETKGKDRIIEVIKYVPIDKVTNGFIEYHNAAAENRELKSMTPDEASVQSEKTLQDAAKVVNNNYTNCNKYIVQIKSLQSLLKTIESMYNVE